MTKILIGIIGILMFLFLCIFTNIPKGLYYEALYQILNPKIWNDIVVITGSKPGRGKIKGAVIFRRCNIYKNDRLYKYEAEDLGTIYRLELLGKKFSVSYSLWGGRKLGSSWAQKIESKKIDSSLTVICKTKLCNIDGHVKGAITYSNSYIQSLRNIILNVKL